MDAYIRRLQRSTQDEPRTPELARYIATLERALGISNRPPSYEEAQHILQTAEKLKIQAVSKIVAAAYADVPTPVDEPVHVVWNMPSELRINWYNEFPPYSEVWDWGGPGQESHGLAILEATRNPFKFNILNPENPDDGAIFGVPRWLFRLSDDEIPVFESIRQYLPERYIAGVQPYDVEAVMDS